MVRNGVRFKVRVIVRFGNFRVSIRIRFSACMFEVWLGKRLRLETSCF